MVDSRPGSSFGRDSAEDPLLGQAGLDPGTARPFGKALDRLGGPGGKASAPTAGKAQKLVDCCPKPRSGDPQEAAQTITREENAGTAWPCCYAVPRGNSITPRKRGYCDGNFKRLEEGTFRWPATMDGRPSVTLRAAELAMLL